MRTFLKLIPVLLSCLFFAGCAFQSEDIALNTDQVTMPSSNIGQGKKVAVEVIDARPRDELGGRASGYGPAAKIKLASDISQIVGDKVSEALKKNGFTPVKAGTSPTKLTIQILNLDYRQEAGFFSAGISVQSTLESQARNKGNDYHRVYRGSQDDRILVTPTTNSDTNRINNAFNASVAKMVSDKDLMQFLAS